MSIGIALRAAASAAASATICVLALALSGCGGEPPITAETPKQELKPGQPYGVPQGAQSKPDAKKAAS